MSKNKSTYTNGKKRVSFSQFSNYRNCRYHWYLDTIKKLRKSEDNVSTCFGTAIHETVQLYIETLYKKSVQEADLHDLKEIFKIKFDKELKDKKVIVDDEQKKEENNNNNNNNKIGNDVDIKIKEHFQDGYDIIDAFKNTTNRIKHFPSNKYEFISVEDEIILPIKNEIEFICYIDVVLKEKNTGRYRIIDIKTSTQGWNHYQRDNFEKISQVLLYKAFFSKKYNVDINMIDVEFFILRRKLWENYSFPQSRIQLFVPKNDQKSVAKALNNFAEFIDECFTPDGKFVEDPKVYLKNPGDKYKNCKYCPHKKVNCFPEKSDIIPED